MGERSGVATVFDCTGFVAFIKKMSRFQQQWLEFKNGRPGHRFQDRYERNKERRAERSSFMRFLKPVAGISLIVAGVVFCLIPGPGLPLLLIGAGLMADVSLPVARGLDRLDVWTRAVISRIKRWWKSSSTAAKSAVILLAVFLVSGVGYGGFRFFIDR